LKKEDCLFEITYLRHEEEIVKSRAKSIAQTRIDIGKRLGKKFPIDADYVIPMPETAVFNAIGYHLETGIPYCLGVYKTRPKIKTLFIDDREVTLKETMITVPQIIEGKRIVIVDETVISGLTLKVNIEKIRKHNPKEIHLRLVIAPMTRTCPSSDFGEDWVFAINENNNLAEFFGVDSIEWLSPEDYEDFVNCSYCFGGKCDNSKMVKTKF